MCNKPYPQYEVESINNLKELVNRTSEKYHDKTAFIFERDNETVNVSYLKFKSDVDALGTALFDMKIRDINVAVIGENSYEWILTYLAVVNSGNILVPIDKELPAIEIMNLLKHSGTQALVYSGNYTDIEEFLRKDDMPIKHYICMDMIDELIVKGNSLIQNGNQYVVNYEIDNNKLAALLYTSGTTGNAKGVMLSHKNIACNAVRTCKIVSFPDSFLLILPLHHIFALDVGIAVMMLHGASIAINTSLKNIPGDMQKYKPRNIFMVPLFAETFYKQIVSLAGENATKDVLKQVASKVFGGNLKTIGCGSAPIDVKYINGYRELGIEFVEGYGLTECAGVGSTNRNKYYRDGSIGQLIPDCELKIMNPDKDGNGEIYIKGDIVMLGYYQNEEATAETFDGEWLKTGDIGYIDDDGFLYISGRKKNMILLSNGKNIYPEEIEFELLKQIPHIKEAVVYAEDDSIVAEVFIDKENHPGYVSKLDDDIAKFNKTQAVYKNIGKTVIRDTEFPKTTTKKIKRQYK